MIAVNVKTTLQTWQFQQPPSEGLESPKSLKKPNDNNVFTTGNGTVIKKWNSEDIGFFDPDYEGTGLVVNAGKNVFYRDVYVFIN